MSQSAIQSNDSISQSISQEDESNYLEAVAERRLRRKIASRRTMEFILEFQKFLQKKIAIKKQTRKGIMLNASTEQVDPIELVSSQIRQKKLQQNNSEAKVNRMMNGFKQVDTYVNVKSFVQNMNLINQGGSFTSNKKQIKTFHSPVKKNQFENLNYFKEDTKITELIDRVRCFLKHKNKSASNTKTQYFEQLLAHLNSRNQFSTHNLLNESNIQLFGILKQCEVTIDANKLESQASNAAFNQGYGKIPQKPRQGRQMNFLINKLEPPIINQNYCEQFQNNVKVIGRHMNKKLNMVSKQAFNQRIRQYKKMRNCQSEIPQVKPVLDYKYRLFAPKNTFRFKIGTKIYEQHQLPSRPLNKQRYSQHSRTSKDPQTTNISTAQTHSKYRNSNYGAYPTLFANRSAEDRVCFPTAQREAQPKYAVYATKVRQNLLKKIEHFIKKTEQKQKKQKQHNMYLYQVMAEVENQRTEDFNRFKDQVA